MTSMDIEKIADYFTDSLRQVLRTMAGFEVSNTSCDQLDFSDKESNIIGIMVLHGKKDAVISLSMEYSTATMVIAYMTGILPEELSESDLFDGVAELVNIMAGEVKARLSNTPYHFLLTSPFSIGGTSLKVARKKNLTEACRHLKAGEMDITFRIAYI
ncbi:MAG: chemotaxis protein CheX [Caldicoprobacterales bacterium]